MNVDDDDDEETQRPRTVSDYGIEVDFDGLDDDEREVCLFEIHFFVYEMIVLCFRIPHLRLLLNSTKILPS